MDIAEYIYESVVEPSYKHFLSQIITMLVISGKLKENLPQKTLIQDKYKRWQPQENV